MNSPEFLAWAFGEDYAKARLQVDLLNRWNERHGDMLKFHINGRVVEDTTRMFELWWESKESEDAK